MPFFSRLFSRHASSEHTFSHNIFSQHTLSGSLFSGPLSPRITHSFYTLSFFLFLSTAPTLFAMDTSNARAALQKAISLGIYEDIHGILNNLPEEEIQEHLPQVLYSAVHHKEYEIVELALQAGTHPNMFVCGEESGFTLLMHAALHSLPSIVHLLISYGADVTMHDQAGHDALFFCSGNNPEDGCNIALILKEEMVKVGFSPEESLNCTLHETIRKNRKTDVSCFVEALIELGADPQIQDKSGNSLLDISLQQLSPLDRKNLNTSIREKIKMLYRHGAHTSTRKISDYFTPEEIAELEREREIKQIRLADERFLKVRYSGNPELAMLSFENQRGHATQEELYEHCPLPNALVQLTHEYLRGPNPRKRKRADNSAGNSALNTKSRKLEEEEEEKKYGE